MTVQYDFCCTNRINSFTVRRMDKNTNYVLVPMNHPIARQFFGALTPQTTRTTRRARRSAGGRGAGPLAAGKGGGGSTRKRRARRQTQTPQS
jgi:hypothetical protein